jgi:Icc-related predicted phosphoesterase
MPFYAAADLHGHLPEVPDDAEVLFLVGDICPDFAPSKRNHADIVDKGGQRQRAWLDGEFRAWLTPLADRGVQVVATWGNHDFVGEKPFLVPDLPWTLLIDGETTVKGLRVWGTPWVPTLSGWAFYQNMTGLHDRANRIPEGIDVLLTHGPPYGAGDRLPNHSMSLNPEQRVGDEALVGAIERVRPKVVLCGHIHEDRGMHVCADVPVYNVAAVNIFYDLHRDPYVRVYDLED